MDQKQVDKIVHKDYADFQTSVFVGVVPKGIVQLFINAIMTIAPQAHHTLISMIEGISNKTEETLTIEELSVVVKVLLNTPFDKLYADLWEAIERHKEIENFVATYNAVVDAKTKELTRKRESLLNLSGVNKGIVKPIIGKA